MKKAKKNLEREWVDKYRMGRERDNKENQSSKNAIQRRKSRIYGERQTLWGCNLANRGIR